MRYSEWEEEAADETAGMVMSSKKRKKREREETKNEKNEKKKVRKKRPHCRRAVTAPRG
jgi:hypothetical protein